MRYEDVIRKLKAKANPKNVAGMARFGINPEHTLGLSIPFLRGLAKELGKDHGLAQKLWDSRIHEARILAGFIDDPLRVTAKQMDAWVLDFDSWDVCDQVCCFLFDRTPHAYSKALEWSGREREFEKRAGFTLMAALAWHDKKAPDGKLAAFLPVIRQEAADGRNYVKKAVNWALRNIGKRNTGLNRLAIRTAREILRDADRFAEAGDKVGAKAARWVASDALRELTGPAVAKRLAKKEKKR